MATKKNSSARPASARPYTRYSEATLDPSTRQELESFKADLLAASARARTSHKVLIRVHVPGSLMGAWATNCPEHAHAYRRNAGQRFESAIRWLFGENPTADKVPYDKEPDLWAAIAQLKAGRASLTHGIDIQGYLNRSASQCYWYSPDGTTVYVMSPDSYGLFTETWGTVTKDSRSNKGKEKYKVNNVSNDLLSWLHEHSL